MAPIELTLESVATGGESVAHDDSGRVVFVAGGIPGETVGAELTSEKKSFARANLSEVIEASPYRIEPPCRHVAEGCGGCDWQHIVPEHQRELRRNVVVDSLSRLGGIEKPLVELGPELPSLGYRTTVRCIIVNGSAGYRRRATRDGIAVDDCLIAHPLLQELIAEGNFGNALEVTLRVGARTGERLALVYPSAEGVSLPSDVRVIGADELKAGRRAWYHEVVADRTWRVSASSFFQARPDGAEALLGEAGRLIEEHAPGAQKLVDLCSGVGLFAGALAQGRQVVAVESHPAAIADARINLADDGVQIVKSSFERWQPGAEVDVVLADPARSGLGRRGVEVVAKADPSLIVLVSCDPAALGHDAGLLAAAGYALIRSTLVDLFPQTSHVETVSGFLR